MNNLVTFFCFIILVVVSSTRAQEVYFKYELPIAIKIAGGDSKSDNKSSAILRQKQVIKPTPINHLGFGFIYSDNIDFEILFGQNKYDYHVYNVGSSAVGLNSPVNHELFGFAYPSDTKKMQNAYCTKTEAGFVTTSEICGTKDLKINIINGIKASGHINTFVALMKVKPFAPIKMFVPYVSAGFGLANSKIKYSLISIFNNVDSVSRTSRKNTLAMEFGIGTKVKITDKFNLDISAKYFDYGKHLVYLNNAQKIKGYKLSLGFTISF